MRFLEIPTEQMVLASWEDQTTLTNGWICLSLVCKTDTESQEVTNYTNEGHVIYYSQPTNEVDPTAGPVPLRVQTHPCSTAQFVLLAGDAAL